MNSYSSLRKSNNGMAMAVVSLVLCLVISASMLFSRLMPYVPEDRQHYIPLTRGNGVTTVLTGCRAENGEIRFARPYQPGQGVLLAASPFLSANWFRVYDEDTVWQGETDVEIFRISYENGDGQVTVRSTDGDKLLAPGTENTYRFALDNTGSNPVQYEMSMEAYFSHGEHEIPVVARVSDHTGRYLCGSPEDYEDVLELNEVSDSGTLKAGYVMPYTLEWEWPFEGDDAYDTMLGNLAEDEDVTLTIVIKTLASYVPESQAADGGIPKTGDESGVRMAFAVMIASLAGLLLMLLISRRKQEENHG